jgi:16S rRNA (guanine527-N7)-methyltransferase
MREHLTEAAEHGVRLSDAQLEQFGRYHALLHDWSSRANLVGNPDVDVVARRHFLESIAFGAALREREILRPDAAIIDVGSGAGFPGVPIKIVCPSVSLTLLEATKKKVEFLEALVSALDLTDTRVMCSRAETLAHDAGFREQFDLALARAVAPLPVLLEWTLPFVRVGRRVATIKGSRAAAELFDARGALETLGGRAFSFGLNVPGPPQTVVVVSKQRRTPEQYPRRAGAARKAPL